LREAVRSAPVEAGWDAVFIVRAGSVGANYHQMKLAVNNLLGRANLIANNYDSLPTGSDIH
jgi:RNase P protein component